MSPRLPVRHGRSRHEVKLVGRRSVLCILCVEDNEDNGYMLKMRLKLTDEFEAP